MKKRLVAILVPWIFSGAVHAVDLDEFYESNNGQQGVLPSPDVPTVAPASLDDLLNPVSEATTGVSDLRIQMLTEAARTVGFRGGLAERAAVLKEALDSRAARLDTIFQFSMVMNSNGTVPPVIVEARDLSSVSSDQIRTANRVYKIVREERFAAVPPTWRDYLLVGLVAKNDGVELPDFAIRPKNGEEESIWKAGVRRGWEEGQKQAQAILAANFNRLTRDYVGMLRYSTLIQTGMISTTKVAESSQTVTGDSKQLMLGDTLKRVTSRAAFQPDAGKWRPTVNLNASEAAKKAKEQRDREQAERLAKEEAERLAREEAERKAKEEADRIAREEAERLAKAQAEQQAKEEAERKAKEEADRLAQEEAERLAKAQAEQQAKEEAERKAKEDAARIAKEQAAARQAYLATGHESSLERLAQEGAVRKDAEQQIAEPAKDAQPQSADTAKPEAVATQAQESAPAVVQSSDAVRAETVMMLVEETEKWKQLAQEQAAEQEAKKKRKRKAR